MSRVYPWVMLLVTLALLTGCRPPGKPRPGMIPQRPDQITDFQVLYRENCAACHGAEGKGGAAVALANPAYIAYAGFAPLQAITANGIPGSLMPAFAKSAGGLLTDQQVAILARGITGWASPQQLGALHPPVYESQATGDISRGEALYRADCLHCHAAISGSVLDPVYLGLISNGGLRTVIVTGKAGEGMPDWRGYPSGPLTDQQIADLVSFLVSHRRPAFHAAANVPANSATVPQAATQPAADRKVVTP